MPLVVSYRLIPSIPSIPSILSCSLDTVLFYTEPFVSTSRPRPHLSNWVPRHDGLLRLRIGLEADGAGASNSRHRRAAFARVVGGLDVFGFMEESIDRFCSHKVLRSRRSRAIYNDTGCHVDGRALCPSRQVLLTFARITSNPKFAEALLCQHTGMHEEMKLLLRVAPQHMRSICSKKLGSALALRVRFACLCIN